MIPPSQKPETAAYVLANAALAMIEVLDAIAVAVVDRSREPDVYNLVTSLRDTYVPILQRVARRRR